MSKAVSGYDGLALPVANELRAPYKPASAWLAEVSKLRYQTPFMLTDLMHAHAMVRYVQQLLPGVNLYFAVKSNSDRRLLGALNDLLAGFEIASAGEFRSLEKLGIDPRRVLFSNPVKIPRHIRDTFSAGVRRFAFDGVGELEKLARYAPGSQVYARIEVADSGSTFPLSKKFGMPQMAVVDAMVRARELGLEPYGIAFHVGSQSRSPDAWRGALESSGALIRSLAASGIAIRALNIGGGLPASYVRRSQPLEPIAAAITQALQEYIPQQVQILAEPGRAIAASSSIIATTIIGREKRGGKEWLFLDMGTFQGLIEPLQASGWRYPVFSDYHSDRERLQRYVLTGPTCDPGDTIGEDYCLPARLRIGDRLYIGSAGAYTTVYGSSFNGFTPPRTYYLS